MFEEVSIAATQMLLQLFWLFLAVIFIVGLVWSRTGRNPKPD